ncbi:hypothetical protein BDW42DRAFT_155880 [Aspergillus taichungensis]|uniref:cyclin-dependent kinase n=1 Tax=Aspergillus taichungensis TaxID=482145 RepID=A0A2J5HKN8_9EURO|nr:hypothetical protein BDW42DRAFT_155880 [Aspergillus taichungensis]
MAGSHRSPLNDQWRGASDPRDQRNRDRHRPRGSYHDRERDTFRDRGRGRRPKEGRSDHALRSPPPRPFPPFDNEPLPPRREFSPGAASARGSPGRHRPFTHGEHTDMTSRPSPEFERNYLRDASPSAPPSKRKRTRSPSPNPYRHHPNYQPHRRPPFRGERRGRFPGRGRSRGDPRRGRDRRGGRRNSSLQRRSRSPVRGAKSYTYPRRRFHSPYREGDAEDGSRYRSMSRDSLRSDDSRYSVISRRDSRGDPSMHTNYPVRSTGGSSVRSLSPPRRRMSGFDADNANISNNGDAMDESFSRQEMHGPEEDGHHPRSSRMHADSGRYSKSPRYSPTNSNYGSPQPSYHEPVGNSPPYWQDNHAANKSQSQYYKHQSSSSSYPGPSHRPGSGYRGGYQGHGGDRRFSGPGPPGYGNGPSPRGRGGFHRGGRGGPRSPRMGHRSSLSPPPPPPPASDELPYGPDEGESAFKPPNKFFDSEGEGPKAASENGDSERSALAAQQQQPSSSAAPNKGGKISFAIKAKPNTTSAPKPVPDLAQRMLAREPPSRVAEPPRNRMPMGPPPKFRPDPRSERRERDRDRDWDAKRDRDREKGRNDRRDLRDSRGFREFRGGRDAPRGGRDSRRDDRRFDNRHDRRRGGDRRPDYRPERHPERSPEAPKQSKILTRPKPRPTLPEEFAKSDSVYFRKPGNESVIGAGTYGKVFKAIHVYTEQKVALKKIRMEGEKDGFPVTAVREIKLLQHLRSDNVVSLLEVMVERNECFMVFEYLSHDLTGLINHPTFALTAAHKKDLAKQMFAGLNYLHHRGILHRDIKAANILISNRGQLKYADFGLARFFSKSRQADYTNRVITIWYRPPELLLGETRYGPAVDVWSAACVYVEMFTKKAVFPGEGGEISQLDKLYNSLGTPTRAEWPDLVEMPWFELMRPTERKKRVFEETYREVLSPAALDLVSQVFQYDPAKRPTAEQVLLHPYFMSEEPQPQQAIELENIVGDWHEFESKALRKEKDKERRAEYQRDREKRKAGLLVPASEREMKRVRPEDASAMP